MSSYSHRHKQTLKRLKRRFGVVMQIISKAFGPLDLATGVRSETETTTTIKKAILLPATDKSQFVYDIAYLAANKNFTSGGEFDTANVDVIIDGDDLPSGFEFDDTYSIVINNQEYQFVNIKRYMATLGYIIRLKYIKSYGTRQ